MQYRMKYKVVNRIISEALLISYKLAICDVQPQNREHENAAEQTPQRGQ